MKNTKENVIELLEKLKSQRYEMARIVIETNKDNEAWAREHELLAIAYNDAIMLLNDEKYFNSIWDILASK